MHVGGEGGRWWLREFHSDKLVEDGGLGGLVRGARRRDRRKERCELGC